MGPVDFVKFAFQTTRDEFAAACPCLFLVGTQTVTRPRAVHRTIEFSSAALDLTPPPKQGTAPHPVISATPPSVQVPVAYAIRKAKDGFTQMITVGRTPNSDIMIGDLQVSKFHAFFRETEEGLLLSDAGSRNGTFVSTERLVAKAKPTPVSIGASISFGKLRFSLLDARRCWDFLRRQTPTPEP